jgi:flagellar protein FliO/FliZ
VSPRYAFLIGALAVSTATKAADVAPPASFGPGLLQATVGLAVVLALIWGAAWITRRISPLGASSRSPIKLVATLALGQRERVVLVELGDQWLLLGVAPGQVNALHTGAKSTLPQTAAADPTGFAKLLAMATRKRGGA